MATNVKLRVALTPIGEPMMSIRVHNYTQHGRLCEPTTVDIEFDTDSDMAILEIEHSGKTDTDPTTAIVIDSIDFFGIQDPKFVWAGIYYPEYPKPWASQQSAKPPAEIIGQTYMGWNGIYRLTFGVPVFTWMHQIQNLGWIYQ
jgi:hypothetical protein